MDLDLQHTIALITGGSKGIGLACAKGLLAEGASVAIASRSEANLASAGAVLGTAFTMAADLVDEGAAASLVDAVERELGPIDILVNSAGAARRTPPDALTPQAWHAAMDAKFFTYINVIDPVIKRMAARRRGVIVNIIGSGGKIAAATHLAGGAANAALMLATAGLANAYAPSGVRVLGVNPGLTLTDRVAEGMKAEAQLLGMTEAEALRRSVARLALGRLASPRGSSQHRRLRRFSARQLPDGSRDYHGRSDLAHRDLAGGSEASATRRFPVMAARHHREQSRYCGQLDEIIRTDVTCRRCESLPSACCESRALGELAPASA